jgi:hypothetical protein
VSVPLPPELREYFREQARLEERSQAAVILRLVAETGLASVRGLYSLSVLSYH